MARHRHARNARINPLLGSVLVGSTLAAGLVLPGAGIASAAPSHSSDPECIAVGKAQHDLDQAERVYRKQQRVVTAAEARYRQLPADPHATAAEIGRARRHLHDAIVVLGTLDTARGAARRAVQEAVAAARGHGCDGPNPLEGGPIGGGPVRGWGPVHHPRPGHRPVAHPSGPTAPVITVESRSSSSAVAVPAGAPSGDEWLGRVGDWFTGSDGHASAPAQAPSGDAAEPAYPTGAVGAGDGSSTGLDIGHIGLALIGLGGLGLGCAGTAELVARRRRRS